MPEPELSETRQELFHYTSISALEGILETNTLWATRTSHLNDTSELQLIWPRIEPLVIDFYEQELRDFCRLNPSFNARIQREGGVTWLASTDGPNMAQEFRSRLQGHRSLPSIHERYVASFTTHSQAPVLDTYHREHGMLSQWRGYGIEEGVAVVFDQLDLQELIQAECKHFYYWQSDPREVIYDKSDGNLEKDFPELHEALGKFVHNWIFHNADMEKLKGLLDDVYRELLLAVTKFKHIAFHEEREWRIVMGVILESCLAEFDSVGGGRAKSLKQIHHRKGNCGSVPYVRLFEECSKQLPIKRIIVGPSRNQNAHADRVQDLVGSRRIPVKLSKTPFVESV